VVEDANRDGVICFLREKNTAFYCGFHQENNTGIAFCPHEAITSRKGPGDIFFTL